MTFRMQDIVSPFEPTGASVEFECHYFSNDRRFIFPTIALSAMVIGGGIPLVRSTFADVQSQSSLGLVVACTFMVAWLGTIGGCASILVFGFLRPTKLYFRITKDEITWRNGLLGKGRAIRRCDVRDYDFYFQGSYPSLKIRDLKGKRYTIRAIVYVSEEDVDTIDDLLSTGR